MLAGFAPLALAIPLKVRFRCMRSDGPGTDGHVRSTATGAHRGHHTTAGAHFHSTEPPLRLRPFVIGKSNDVAAAAAQAAAHAPGNVYNPLSSMAIPDSARRT